MSAFEFLAASPSAFIGVCLVLGLIVGSFLNVVIYRLPLMLERQWREQFAEDAPSADAPQAAADSQNRDAPGSFEGSTSAIGDPPTFTPPIAGPDAATALAASAPTT